MRILLVAAILAATPVLAYGDEPTVTARAGAEDRYAFGARIGGYGFRQPANAHSDQTGWTGCRMNGLGLFAERGLGQRFFVEAGLDAYFADDLGTEWHDHDGDGGAGPWIDRVSGLASVAGGVRLLPGARVSPYLQLGVGLELTRVSVAGGEESFALPIGFIGIGGDLRIGRARLGMNVRVHAMGYFPEKDGVYSLDPEPELAAQGQFYAKFEL